MSRTNEIKVQPAELDEDKAWLLGHLAGDGGVRRREVAVYAGPDHQIAMHVVALFSLIYGVPARITPQLPGRDKRKQISYRVDCYSTAAADDILSIGSFGLVKWRVPKIVLDAPENIRCAWLSGMFDADGSMTFKVETSRRTVNLTSVNLAGMDQVSAMLDALGIRHGRAVRKPKLGNWRLSHSIFITYHEDLRRFSDMIGFRATRKQEKLDAALASYQRLVLRTEDVQEHAEEIVRRRRAGETHASIAESLDLSREVVAGVCYRNGAEPEGREGNAAGGTRSVAIGKVERHLATVVELKDQGVPLREIAERVGLRNESAVQSLLQRSARKGEIERYERGTHTRESIDSILRMRGEGKKWREIGRALGHEGTDQQAAVYAMGVLAHGRKLGLVPDGVTKAHGTKWQDAIPRIHAMRSVGRTLDEIGRELGVKPPNVATKVSNMIRWAKARGIWPDEPSTPPPPAV